jgi:hypothetical protein
LAVGVDDGTQDFNGASPLVPGNSTSTGLSFVNGSWGWEIKTASTVLFSDYASGTKALAVGDIFGFEFDTTAHTCQVWRKKSGTWTSLGTVSTGFTLSAYYAFAGAATGQQHGHRRNGKLRSQRLRPHAISGLCGVRLVSDLAPARNARPGEGREIMLCSLAIQRQRYVTSRSTLLRAGLP